LFSYHFLIGKQPKLINTQRETKIPRKFKQTRKSESRGIYVGIFKEGEDEKYIFHRFPIGWLKRTKYVTTIDLFYNNRNYTWRVSNSEELVGLFTGDCVSEFVMRIFK